ncbi:hypothetical protein [Pararhizobium sp.]|uniref:hypothetical protein n=1 Tax=Pararhizobium sp. TaxID=1977563 RepID=UPI0027241B79|nr:hypothetical protein [Pararhizobium sp.]MDO9418953.1 hypothetical protein [Pararhizobium sp.]
MSGHPVFSGPTLTRPSAQTKAKIGASPIKPDFNRRDKLLIAFWCAFAYAVRNQNTAWKLAESALLAYPSQISPNA